MLQCIAVDTAPSGMLKISLDAGQAKSSAGPKLKWLSCCGSRPTVATSSNCRWAIAPGTVQCAQQQEEEDAHRPFGSVLCAMLPHDNFNILEEVLEQGLLGLHLICCLLTILHGSIPWRQGKHEPQLPPAVICCQCFPVQHIVAYLNINFDMFMTLFRGSTPHQEHRYTQKHLLAST